MKRLGFAVMFALAAAAALAQRQSPTQEELAEKRDEKLKHEFFSKATWIMDFGKAREEAKKSGKPIFAYFTRSYAN